MAPSGPLSKAGMTKRQQTTTPPESLSSISPWIARFADQVPANGTVLDLACGRGRHTAFFLEQGHKVTALDKDTSALNHLKNRENLEILTCDLEDGSAWPLGPPELRQFSAIVVVNYLYRPILPRIIDAIEPGGILLYDTFALGNEAFGRPKNPDFLLHPGELEAAVEGKLEVLASFHGLVEIPQPAMRQQICARRS